MFVLPSNELARLDELCFRLLRLLVRDDFSLLLLNLRDFLLPLPVTCTSLYFSIHFIPFVCSFVRTLGDNDRRPSADEVRSKEARVLLRGESTDLRGDAMGDPARPPSQEIATIGGFTLEVPFFGLPNGD